MQAQQRNASQVAAEQLQTAAKHSLLRVRGGFQKVIRGAWVCDMFGPVQVLEEKTQNQGGDWTGASMTVCSTHIPVGEQVNTTLCSVCLFGFVVT